VKSNRKSEELEFRVSEEYTKDDIRKVQHTLLFMAKIVSGILEQHSIPYFITNGTLLGAVRHERFIPWDDDFDIFLFDDTYETAMSHLENELPEHLIVHSLKNDPKYFPAWNRVKNITTSAMDSGLYNPDNKLLKYQCLSLDMYRIKKMRANEIKRYKIKEALQFFKRKLDFGIISEKFYQKSTGQLEIQLIEAEREASSASNREAVYMFMLMLKEPLLPEHIFPLKKYTFENEKFWGPASSDVLLRSLYGDYHTIPEYEDRRTRISKITFN